MSPAGYICTGCQRLHDGRAGARCLECLRSHTQQRNAQPHRRAHRTQAHARLRELVLRRDGYRCVECGATSDLTLDYIVPLQDGGTMTPDNAQTRCRPCNAHHGRRRFFRSAQTRTPSNLKTR